MLIKCLQEVGDCGQISWVPIFLLSGPDLNDTLTGLQPELQ